SRADESGTVLIIDDDLTVHDLLQRTLGKDHYRIEGAWSGEEGIALAHELKPAVIILDVLMPGMDGWAVLTTLKSDPATADIPIVMLTILQEQNLGFTLGASDYLTKPIDQARLQAVLRKYVEARLGPLVMVVDDDGGAREMTRRMLEREACRVIEAANGREALERFEMTSPDVVLLDLMMPVLDGFDFVHEARQVRGWTTPIVVLTAKDLTVEERARLNGQVQRILSKGAFTRDDLLQEVRTIVSRTIREDVAT
ncbi:MAG TPA: response regulator, partial [Chloroflexota bacterium]|nr:response regulator [Chloroflexota bacterium]